MKQTLDSLIAQTCSDWEAIIVDNYSEDDTIAIIKSYQDPRLKLIRFRNEGNIGASRNQAISAARGKWIAFLDSDDLWLPAKLELCRRALDEETDVLGHGVEMFNSEDGRTVRYRLSGPTAKTRYQRLLFGGNCLTPSAALIRRTTFTEIGGFSPAPEFSPVEDFDLWLRMSKNGARFQFIEDMLTRYRLHAGQGTIKGVLAHMTGGLSILDHHFRRLENPSFIQKILLARARALLQYGAGRYFQKGTQRKDALSWFLRAMRTYPLSPKIYGAIFLLAIGR